MNNRAGRLWRTLSPLKPVQIWGRAWFRLRRIKPDLRPAPPLRQRNGPYLRPAARAASLHGPSLFCFQNDSRDIRDYGWDNPSLPKLWRYNLHYFDDLIAEGHETRAPWHQCLILRWIKENPPGRGSGWEPYPMSLRIVNWIRRQLTYGDLPPEALQSLVIQLRALRQRFEWHLLGNHLFVNAKALLMGSLLFDGPEAARWRQQALKVLLPQLHEQFLEDGGQFELTPMYHALGLEDLLDLLNIGRAFPGELPEDLIHELDTRATRARIWLERMSHPDGQIAFFNDAAFGVAPETANLQALADLLGLAPVPPAAPLEALPASGYWRLSLGEAVLIADCGEIGPSYLPGHAHADTLSFEFSLYGQRVFVNSGTGEYGVGAERIRQRGTAAHNTVICEGQDSSEVWSGFRVGRRARILNLNQQITPEMLTLSASHDGYRFLPGAPRHHRRFVLRPQELRIEDCLSVPTAGEARFHLHPEVTAQLSPEGAQLTLPGGQVLTLHARGLRHEESRWHPEFGLTRANICLILPLVKGVADVRMTWS